MSWYFSQTSLLNALLLEINFQDTQNKFYNYLFSQYFICDLIEINQETIYYY